MQEKTKISITRDLEQTVLIRWILAKMAIVVLKTSSNTTIPEAWITDPATESWYCWRVRYMVF